MGSIVLFVQESAGKVSKSSLIALTAALELQAAWKKDAVVAVVLGLGAKVAAEELSAYSLSKIYWSAAACLEKYTAPQFSACIEQLLKEVNADTLVAAATSTGKDLLPRLAAHMDAGQASDIIAVNLDGSLKRPMYAGNVLADVEILTPKRVVSVRTTAFLPAKPVGQGAVVVELALQALPPICEVISYDKAENLRPELVDAAIVVSGGRGLGSADNFEKIMFPLADSLGAAVGASRAAVDSGFAPNDWQVGQTGKVVAPTLYIAVGISGAIQHLAGMKDSRTIVAINKNADEPIFEVADFGLVADLFTAIPELVAEIGKAKAS